MTSQRFDAERRHHLDVLADQSTQHLARVDDDRVQVDDARLQQLLPPECEELLCQRCRALGRLLDRFDVCPKSDVALVDLAEQEVAVYRDDGQQVVEVVRDAAGEAADRIELLRLIQAFLEALPVADVVDHAHGELRIAVRIAYERCRQVTPHHLAVGAPIPLLEREALTRSADELGEQLVPGR